MRETDGSPALRDHCQVPRRTTTRSLEVVEEDVGKNVVGNTFHRSRIREKLVYGDLNLYLAFDEPGYGLL